MDQHKKIVYKETQRLRQWWVWLLVLGVAIIFWYVFIKQVLLGIEVGDQPVSNPMAIFTWILFGIIPVLFFGTMKYTIEVYNDGVYIQFFPFHWRKRIFLFKDILKAESIPYRISDFGGLGIRLNMVGEIAYNLNGKKAIRLKLKEQTVVIGTNNPKMLKNTLHAYIDFAKGNKRD